MVDLSLAEDITFFIQLSTKDKHAAALGEQK